VKKWVFVSKRINNQNHNQKSIQPLPSEAVTIHRVFGSLFGVWIGLLFSRRIPNGSIYSYIFVLYVFVFIGSLAVILHAGLTRKTIKQRIIAYILLTITSFLMLPGIGFFNQYIYPVANSLTTWEIVFLVFVLIFWCLAAEFGIKTQSIGDQIK
jgi:hypothetical protein